jgi:uncharacterized membrane protein
MLLVWAFNLLAWVSAYPEVVALIVVLTVWGVATLFFTWARPYRSQTRRLFAAMCWGTVILTLAAFAAWALLNVVQSPGYGTDELAFDQYAAHLLTQGVNPYTHSMAPAFPLFHVQPDGYTYQLNGAPVTSLSYPALSFLVYVPVLLLGASSQVAVAYNVVAWMIAILVMLVLLPKAMRPMALVIGSLSVYAGFAVGGVTVALYVPLLVGAVYAWHRWPDRRGWRSWVSPVFMGLALCINQVPWFVFPFVVVGIAIEAARRRGRARSGLYAAARYTVIAAVVALIPNVPFIYWDAHAWLRGILTPLVRQTVPAGQGLIALALYQHAGGGSLKVYSAITLLAALTVLIAFVAHYPRLRSVAILLPAVPLLLATRSYGSYVFGLIPAALVAAVTTFGTRLPERQPRSTWRLRWRRPWQYTSPWSFAAGGLAILTVAAAGAAIAAPAPLSMSIEDVTTTGQLATVQQVSVQVHNRSSRSLQPHFTLNSGDAVTTFWLIQSGPRSLRPGQTATYSLLAPNFYAQPAVNGGFQVVAFTTSPAAVSHTPAYLPSVDHVSLNPDAVNQVIPIGQEVVIHAELLDRLNRPVRRAGVPIYLGQAIYAQAGLQYGDAIINSGNVGQTPISALTNANGVATFTIRGTTASTNPVSFEANLVNIQHFFPYGYSEIVPIRFGS